jgi:oligoendopeptidase F
MSGTFIPKRSEVKKEDTWDLSTLYANDEEWYKDFAAFEAAIPKIDAFKGTLGKSAEALADYLDFEKDKLILA